LNTRLGLGLEIKVLVLISVLKKVLITSLQKKNKQLETKNITSKAMQYPYRQVLVTRVYESEVNYNITSKYLAEICVQFFLVFKNFHCKLANLVASTNEIIMNGNVATPVTFYRG